MGGERCQDGAFIDDDSATYKKVVRKDEYESKVGMRIKPSKSRSISVTKRKW